MSSIVVSPITSYTDQILSIHRGRSSSGFSLDIPLIMLLSSFLRIFYWLGARFSVALLSQSLIMIAMQLILLQTALLHRPRPSSLSTPFAPALSSTALASPGKRPYNFWQWRSPRPYYTTLLYFFLFCCGTYILFPSSPTSSYTLGLGYLALGIEGMLPLPQMWANYRRRSCKGFRLSVLGNWLMGDVMKMIFFFLADGGEGKEAVPLAFKVCGVFQFVCDLALGGQYLLYGDGHEAHTQLREKTLA